MKEEDMEKIQNLLKSWKNGEINADSAISMAIDGTPVFKKEYKIDEASKMVSMIVTFNEKFRNQYPHIVHHIIMETNLNFENVNYAVHQIKILLKDMENQVNQ